MIFFHKLDAEIDAHLVFKIVESSDTSYRVKYFGGDEIFYNGKDSVAFFIKDTSGVYSFIRYDSNGDSVLHANAPEWEKHPEAYRMDGFTAHRYMQNTRRYRIPNYGTDTTVVRFPFFRKTFPFERIGCSLF